jgi:hypothetical protein
MWDFQYCGRHIEDLQPLGANPKNKNVWRWKCVKTGAISVTMTKTYHHTSGTWYTKSHYSVLLFSLFKTSHPQDNTRQHNFAAVKEQTACKKMKALINPPHHNRCICEFGVCETFLLWYEWQQYIRHCNSLSGKYSVI